jgi:peptide/nickel transport system permease protein
MHWRLLSIIGRRLLQAVFVALLVGTFCFFMVRLLPGDMAFRIAAGRYGYDHVNAAAADAVRHELGLDRPILLQLAAWWRDILALDLGKSFLSGERVIDEVFQDLGHSIELAVTAVLIAALIGPGLGMLAGLKPGGWLDRMTLIVTAIVRALPPFVTGLVLILLFAINLRMTPVAGNAHVGSSILPALTLAIGLAAVSCRVARDAMVSVGGSAYFAFARTKGLTDRQALLRHGLRNVGLTVVAYLGVQLVYLIEGVVIVETLFAWPGIGHALVHAIVGRDVPMIQGAAIAMGVLFVLLNTLVDFACLAIDPRRRPAWSAGA